MRLSWAKLALGAVMVAAFAVPISSAVAQQSTDQLRVSVNLKDVDLVTATQELTKLTGLMFVVEAANEPFGKVTLQLSNMPAEDIIQYMCKSAGAPFRRDENGGFILSKTAPTAAKTNETGNLVRPAKMRKRIQLMKGDAETIYNQIMFHEAFDPTTPFKKMNDFMKVVQTSPIGFFGNKGAYEPRLISSGPPVSNPIGNHSFSNPNETGNGVVLPGAEIAGQIGGPGGGAGGFQGGPGAGGGQGGTGLAGGQGLVPEGISYISYDPTDNPS